MTPEQLVDCLRQGELSSSKLVVVDVRDEDRALGWIIGSYWFPSNEFLKDVSSSVNRLLETHTNASKYVFHCQLSQVRGPSCASLFQKEVVANHRNKAQDLEVYILEGGYEAFSRKYGKDEQLVEGT